ncbi:hypothetical protein CRENBAI_005161, partial [Crenichthys baileyi]
IIILITMTLFFFNTIITVNPGGSYNITFTVIFFTSADVTATTPAASSSHVVSHTLSALIS